MGQYEGLIRLNLAQMLSPCCPWPVKEDKTVPAAFDGTQWGVFVGQFCVLTIPTNCYYHVSSTFIASMGLFMSALCSDLTDLLSI